MEQPALFEFFNGRLVTTGETIFNSSNRALRYGDGIFETLCARNGTPLFFKDHWSRLIAGLHLLQIPLPFDQQQLLDSISTILTENNRRHCRIRLILYRKAEGYYQPQPGTASWHLSITGDVPEKYAVDATPLAAGIYHDNYKPCGKLSSLKSLSGLLYVCAGMDAQQKGVDEMLIRNDKGHLCESVKSNLFIRKGERYITPSLQEGCINGIMRKQVIEILRSKNKDIEEGIILEKDVMEADEIFLTNVIRGAQHVGQLNGKTLENKSCVRINSWLDEITL